jgi:membrane-associated phospholipid phosphatase
MADNYEEEERIESQKNKRMVILWAALSTLMIILFTVLTFMLKNVDVKQIGPANSSVGLATFNEAIENTIENASDNWASASNYLMYFSLGLMFIVFCIGVVQYAKRRDIAKIDSGIIAYGAGIVMMIILWLAFDHAFVINYRPILVDGLLEPSYPSTHVMIVIFAFVSTTILVFFYKQDQWVKILSILLSAAVTALIIMGRLLSKKHWATDIVGGVIAALFLIFFFLLIEKIIPNRRDQRETHHHHHHHTEETVK